MATLKCSFGIEVIEKDKVSVLIRGGGKRRFCFQEN